MSEIYAPGIFHLLISTTIAFIVVKIGHWMLKGLVILTMWRLVPETVPDEVRRSNFKHAIISKHMRIERYSTLWRLFSRLLRLLWNKYTQ